MTTQVITDAVWENENKERAIVIMEDINDAGESILKTKMFIAKDSPQWEQVQNSEFNEEHMDQKWEEHIAGREERRQKEEEGRKRTEERIKQEALFARKLEIFEIPEIKASKNRKAKGLVRKAESDSAAIVYAAMIVAEELAKAEDE